MVCVGALQKCAYMPIREEQAANRISKRLAPGPGGHIFVNERGGYDLVQTVMMFAGPPANAVTTWLFAEFSTWLGCAAFARAAGAVVAEIVTAGGLEREPSKQRPAIQCRFEETTLNRYADDA